MKDAIPKEEEKIAAKRAFRLAEKIKLAKIGIAPNSARWCGKPLETFLVLLILALNVFVVFRFFDFPAVDQPFSGPIFPLLVNFVRFFNIPDSLAFQLVNGYFYIILPLAIYLFVKEVTGRKLIAFLAAMIVSLPIYPLAETRFLLSFGGVDAAHIASLAIIPIALLSYYAFIKNGGIKNLVAAAITSALIALISPFGFMTFLVFSSFLAFSEMLLGGGRLKFFRYITVLFFAGSLNSFWYNPIFFTWMIAGPMGAGIRLTVSKLIPLSFFVIPILGALGYLLFDRKPNLQPFFIVTFFTISFGLISIAGGGIFPSHSSRYMPELGISLALLISVLFVGLVDYIRLNFSFKAIPIKSEYLANTFLIVVIPALIFGIIWGAYGISFNEKVLGAWDQIEKGDIWLARDRFMGGFAFLGYGITAASSTALTFFVYKDRNNKNPKEETVNY